MNTIIAKQMYDTQNILEIVAGNRHNDLSTIGDALFKLYAANSERFSQVKIYSEKVHPEKLYTSRRKAS